MLFLFRRLVTRQRCVGCKSSNVFAANVSGTELDGEYHLNPGVMLGASDWWELIRPACFG
jgi:hypothetical protein